MRTRSHLVYALSAVVLLAVGAGPTALSADTAEQAALRGKLGKLPWRIVYESYRGKDWELFSVRPDGSGATNLTHQPGVDDLYPHASPDGRRICFVVDEGAGRDRTRNVYVMDASGTGRKRIAINARQPCWSPDGRRVAYLKGEFDRYTTKDFATKGLVFFDVEAGTARAHVNDGLHHLYNLCWSPCGKWLTATVHGGMGHRHANLAFPAEGKAVHKLPHVGGCRPDLSPDGKRVCWNLSDQVIAIADLDLTASPPTVTNLRKAIQCPKTHEVYHSDFSPDGRYIAFSHGPKGGEQVGAMAKGWHIHVAEAARPDVWIAVTTDGVSNKEPDWLPAPEERGR